MKALLTCLPCVCPPIASYDKVSVQGGGQACLLAHVGLEHIPGKSRLTDCLPGQERCSDRLVPPWHHLEGNSEPEKNRDSPELT